MTWENRSLRFINYGKDRFEVKTFQNNTPEWVNASNFRLMWNLCANVGKVSEEGEYRTSNADIAVMTDSMINDKGQVSESLRIIKLNRWDADPNFRGVRILDLSGGILVTYDIDIKTHEIQGYLDHMIRYCKNIGCIKDEMVFVPVASLSEDCRQKYTR